MFFFFFYNDNPLAQQLLFRKRKDVDEYLNLDPFCGALYNHYLLVREKYHCENCKTLDIFNDAFYLMFRLLEDKHPEENPYQNYYDSLQNKYPTKGATNTIFGLTFCLLYASKRLSQKLNLFFDILTKKTIPPTFLNTWKEFVSQYTEINGHAHIPVERNPLPPIELEGDMSNWQEITKDYDEDCIIDLTNSVYSSLTDKLTLLSRIEEQKKRRDDIIPQAFKAIKDLNKSYISFYPKRYENVAQAIIKNACQKKITLDEVAFLLNNMVLYIPDLDDFIRNTVNWSLLNDEILPIENLRKFIHSINDNQVRVLLLLFLRKYANYYFKDIRNVSVKHEFNPETEDVDIVYVYGSPLHSVTDFICEVNTLIELFRNKKVKIYIEAANLDYQTQSALSLLQEQNRELKEKIEFLEQQQKRDEIPPLESKPNQKVSQNRKKGEDEKVQKAPLFNEAFFRSDLTETQSTHIDKELRTACSKRNAGVAVAEVLCNSTNKATYLAIANVPNTDLYYSLVKTYGLTVAPSTFYDAMRKAQKP